MSSNKVTNLIDLPDLSRIPVTTERQTHVPLHKLPNPVGWAILVEMAQPKEVSDGGIHLADESIDAQDYLQFTGRVLKMGPLCYRHEKFGQGNDPWCKVGDWIVFGQHGGQQFKVGNRTFRVIDDDMVKTELPYPEVLKVYI